MRCKHSFKNTSSSVPVFWGIFFLLIANKGFSQAACNGTLGTPVVNITFGSGAVNPGGQLSTVVTGAGTTYNFASYATGTPPSAPLDGDYALVNEVPLNNAWFTGAKDHTGDPNGYMAFFNASPTPGEFYRQTITGLSSGITYEFGAWIANVINVSVLPSGILPNITFEILDASTQSVLATYNTGNIANAASMTWIQYGFLFNVPLLVNSVTLRLSNNNIGGTQRPGNDLAIDDITFRPCVGATPLLLGDFQANVAQQSVVLKWTTFNEINTLSNIIERSYDGINFTAIGSIPATSLIQENKYRFTDQPSFLNKSVFYRLTLMDKDGKYTTSKVVQVSLSSGSVNDLVLSPNPAKDHVQLKFNAAKETFTTLRITDVLGKTVIEKSVFVSKGINNTPVDFQNKLHKGIYYITLAPCGKKLTGKLLVE